MALLRASATVRAGRNTAPHKPGSRRRAARPTSRWSGSSDLPLAQPVTELLGLRSHLRRDHEVTAEVVEIARRVLRIGQHLAQPAVPLAAGALRPAAPPNPLPGH